MGTEFPFFKMRKFWRSTSRQCECTSHHWTVCLSLVKMVKLHVSCFSPK